LDLSWSGGKATSATLKVDESTFGREMKVIYQGKIVSQFKAEGGLVKKIAF
jgi:hypothetical protein